MADLISLRTACKSNFDYYIKLLNIVAAVGLYFFFLLILFLLLFFHASVISSAQLTALWLLSLL